MIENQPFAAMKPRSSPFLRHLRRNRYWLTCFLAAEMGLWQIAQPLQAASITWTAGSGADFDWANSANWRGGLPQFLDDVSFNAPIPNPGSLASPGTINLGAGSTARSLRFNDNYTLQGGGLNLSLGALNVGAGSTARISSVITGTGGLQKDGLGTLILDADNAGLAGNVVLNNGTLVASGQARALGTGQLRLISGQLSLQGDTGTAFGNNTVALGSVAIASDRVSAGTGVTHSLGTLSIGGQTLSAMAGPNVTSGTAGVTFGATTLTANGTRFDVGSGANLTLGAMGGNFSIYKSGAGTLTLAGTSTRANATSASVVYEGRVVQGVAAGLGAATAPLFLAGGTTMQFSSDASTNAYPTTVFGNVNLVPDRATSGAAVTHTLGTLTSIGANTYTVSAGANVASLTADVRFGAAVATGATSLVVGSGSRFTLTSTFNNNGFDTTVSGAGDVTMTGAVSGGGGVVMNSNGLLTLSGANTQGKATVVNSGRVQLGNATALGATAVANALLNGIGVLSTNGQNISLQSVQSAAGTTLENRSATASTLTLTPGAGVNSVLAGSLINGGTATLGVTVNTASGGEVTLSGNNTHTGTTTLTQGRLNINSNTALGTGGLTLTAGMIDNTSGGDVALSANNATTLGGGFTFGGSGNLSFGTGVVTAAAARTVTLMGDTGKTLSFGNWVNSYATSTTTVNAVPGSNSTLRVAAFNSTSTATPGTIAGNGNLIITGGITPTIPASSSVVFSNAGIITLNGASTYTGATTFNAGTVRLNAAGGTATLQATSAPTFAGGAFHYLGAAAGTSQRLGNVTLAAGGSSIQVTGGTSGTSTLNLGTLSGGALSTTTQSALNIRLVGGNSPTVTTTSPASGMVNGLMGARGSITFTDASGNTSFARLTTSSGDNVISGLPIATTLPASGASGTTNYILNNSGVTVTASQSANALQLNNTGSAQSLTINSGQSLTLTSGGLLYTGSGAFTVAGTGTSLLKPASSDLIIHNYGTGGLTISAVIANGTATPTPMMVTGPGVTTLTGVNTYTGVTYITGGSTLSIPNNAALGSGALTLNNGTLQVSGTFSSSRPVTLGLGGGSIEVNGGATFTSTGAVGGTGNFVKKGAGTLVLNAANNYTGAYTHVQNGVLQIGSASGGLPNSSTLVLGNGATSGVLVLGDGSNARSATFTGLMTSGAGTANRIRAGGAAASGTLTYNGVPGTPSVFNGVIGGAGTNENNLNLTLTAGILTLGGENTYNGITTLNGGLLNISHASAIGTGTLTIGGVASLDNTSGAPLTLVGSRTINLNNNLSFGASDSLDLGAGSTMTTTAARTITLNGMPGSTSRLSVGTFNSTTASTLTVNRVQASDAVLSVGVVNLATTTAGTASINGNGNVEITGQLLATAAGTAFTYGGSGTLTVFGSSSYTGATTINGPGLLRLGAGGSLPSGSAFTISSGMFDLNGNNQSLNGNFTLTGPGTISNSSATAATLTVASLSTANTGNLAGNLSAVMTQTGAATSMSGSYTNTGSLSFNNNGTGALTISGSLLNGGNVTLSANNNQAITVSSAVVNAGGFIINNGSGTGTTTIQGNLGPAVTGVVQNSATSNLLLTGNNSQFAGSISLNAGNIQVSSGSTYRFDALALEAGSQILVGPAGNSTVLTLGAGGNVAGTTTLIFNDSGTKTISGSILTTGSSLGGELNLEKGGSADWTLASSLSHNGTTTVSGGILRLAPASLSELIPDRSALILGNSAGVQFVLDGRTETVGSLSGGGAAGGQVQLGSGGHLLVGTDGTSTTFGGAILGTNAFLTKQGNGILTLTGQSGFSGLLDITGGGLVLARPGGQALSSSVDVRLANAGTLLSVTSSETIGRLSTAVDSTLVIAAGTTLTTNHAAASVVRSAKAHASTRVMTVPGGTDGLKAGMIVSATDGNPDLATGTYIVQIINHNQVLLSNTPIATTSSSGKNFTFREVDQMLGGITGAGSWTKLGDGNVVLAGPGNLGGTMTITDGSVIAGGVNVGGRNIIQDTVGNLTSVVLGDSGNPSFILASNGLNLAPFERVGSLGGGHLGDGTVENPGLATVSLTGFNSSGVLAVGANNQDSTYRGRITGTSNSLLMKEGSGAFTWTNNDAATAMDGTIWVGGGEVISNGTQGLGAASNVVLSNAPGVKLTIGTTSLQGDSLAFISGGGRGATRVFSNGVTGALPGNYLTGGNSTIDVGNGLALTSTAAAAQYVYGGSLTGTGGIDKQGNNTLELRGVSNYQGATLVRPAAGVASNVNSVLTIGAYGSASGVGTPSGAGGYGQLPATTILRLQAGVTGSVNANAVFNLNGSTQTVIALTSLNNGGTKTLNFGGGVININNVAGTASNGFFDGALSGLGTINVNATHADGWRLTADTSAASVNNNIVHRGGFNINGGQVILEVRLAALETRFMSGSAPVRSCGSTAVTRQVH
jgi:autotransporter-associated beta strand protein